ncbi:hypothetical protein [Leucobacter luti]|uniref:hypothetical protein n=1 Tax=Leucobacter luti TaxID=340320 RepID=UPI003D0223EB
MDQAPKTQPNWWAGLIAFGFLLPIGTISFDNFTSAMILALVGAAAGTLLFPRRAE